MRHLCGAGTRPVPVPDATEPRPASRSPGGGPGLGRAGQPQTGRSCSGTATDSRSSAASDGRTVTVTASAPASPRTANDRYPFFPGATDGKLFEPHGVATSTSRRASSSFTTRTATYGLPARHRTSAVAVTATAAGASGSAAPGASTRSAARPGSPSPHDVLSATYRAVRPTSSVPRAAPPSIVPTSVNARPSSLTDTTASGAPPCSHAATTVPT